MLGVHPDSIQNAIQQKRIAAMASTPPRVFSQHLLLFSLVLVHAIAALPSPDVCGWPSLREGGRFGPSTVRLAQRLLSKTLGKPIPVDGIFSVELIADIKAFQGAHSLNVTGVLNSDVWPTLVSLCSPLEQVT